jgi:hypothetical protein
MSEEKKGHVKITIEVEVNEPLMDVVKEAMTKMPEMMKHRREERQ